jgi:HD superfamily phosphohydrolase YqeK
LHSIELHTTGDAGMSILDKVVFVADYIEPNRSFRGVQTARKIAKRNLDETVLYIFSAMLRTLAQRKTFICSNTLLGYNELIRYRVGCTF